MRRASLLTLTAVLVTSLLPASAVAQATGLVTDDQSGGLTPDQLAGQLVGEGVTVANVTFTGAPEAGGRFTGGDEIVGFPGGIVLSSGRVADVVGPNDQGAAGYAHGTPGDPDLDALANAGGDTSYSTNDAAVLEFDFVPDRDEVFFDYVFASEEYNEFVGSPFNDVFGFYVNGENCATVNGDPVSINTVNGGTDGVPASNPDAYIDNTGGVEGGEPPLDTQMDGLTVVLQCRAAVNAGTTNRMKLAVADTTDRILDTVTFIRAGSLTTEPPPGEAPTERISGISRIETAVEVSEETFETSTATVVIARSDTYPDALAGAPLARMLDASILLTPSDALHPAPAEEIARLGATRAVILGGEAAIAPQVATDLEAAGVTDVDRIGGFDRFDTAAQIAAELPDGDDAYLAEGLNADPSRGWPDALTVSALAAYRQRPVLLVTNDAVPPPTAAALGAYESATVVGGEQAVSAATVEAVEDLGVDVTRVSGENRYATGRAVADIAVTAGMGPAQTFLASGAAFADALVAGPLVAERGGVLLLVAPDSLAGSPATRDFVAGNADAIDEVFILGGTAAVSDTVEEELSALLEG